MLIEGRVPRLKPFVGYAVGSPNLSKNARLWADFNPTMTPQYGFLTVPINTLGCQPFRVSR